MTDDGTAGRRAAEEGTAGGGGGGGARSRKRREVRSKGRTVRERSWRRENRREGNGELQMDKTARGNCRRGGWNRMEWGIAEGKWQEGNYGQDTEGNLYR